jgi:hypothetical protein
MTFSKKNVKKSDEVRKFDKGKLEIVTVGGFTFAKGTYLPGWKWSKSVKPMVKTDSCQVHHVGFVISGHLSGVMNDGTRWSLGPGDVGDISPGHDAWVVGKKPFVLLDMNVAATGAKK